MSALSDARRLEVARSWGQSPPPLRKRGTVVVADGFGVRVAVERGQLSVADGVGRSRRERRFDRAVGELARVVVLGGSGSISLESLRWLQRAGAALICIDRGGSILCTSGPTRHDARLRRAQAYAPFTDTGLAIVRQLLTGKLAGQRSVLRQLDAVATMSRLDTHLTTVGDATTIEEALVAEAEAASLYWAEWAGLELRFRRQDRARIPQHWRTVGGRHSPLSSTPQLATNPAGALRNYLYALAEAEARLACLSHGLDPALGIVHSDILHRESLPLDLIEPVRPAVDEYVLGLLCEHTFCRSDFYETGRGSCRLLAPLTHELAETLPAWRQRLAPVAADVARTLLSAEEATVEHPRSRPTRPRRASRRTAVSKDATLSTGPPVARPLSRCKRCGDPIASRRSYCDDCLPHYQAEQLAISGIRALANARAAGNDPSHGGQAAERRSATMSHRHDENRYWHTTEPIDPDRFSREILPAIQTVPLGVLMRETGLSLTYVSRIRNGHLTPHPRHWAAFARASES